MALFRREQRIAYDPQTQEPAVRRSICTGEMTAGFIDKQTGQFTDVMRLDGQKGLDAFRRSVGTDEVRIIY